MGVVEDVRLRRRHEIRRRRPAGPPRSNLRHLRFHGHARIEAVFFDGVTDPAGGSARPAADRPGTGLTFRAEAAAPHRVAGSAPA